MDADNNMTERNTAQTEASFAVVKPEVPLSEKISSLLDAFLEIQRVYAISINRVSHMDRLTQDYLHALELQNTNYHERARIANALQQCRIQRRPDKNNVCLTEPIVSCLKTKQGQAMLGQLEHLRNLARNAERSASGRKYHPRVLTPEEYENVAKKQERKSRLKRDAQDTPE